MSVPPLESSLGALNGVMSAAPGHPGGSQWPGPKISSRASRSIPWPAGPPRLSEMAGFDLGDVHIDDRPLFGFRSWRGKAGRRGTGRLAVRAPAAAASTAN